MSIASLSDATKSSAWHASNARNAERLMVPYGRGFKSRPVHQASMSEC